MSRIKGARASSMDVAAFTKKKAPPFKKKGFPAKKVTPTARPMPMDAGGMDEGAGDTMPEQDTDLMRGGMMGGGGMRGRGRSGR